MLSWTVTSHIHTHTHKLSTLRLRYIYTFWHCISIYLSWQDIPHPGHPGDILMTSHQCHYHYCRRHSTHHCAPCILRYCRVTCDACNASRWCAVLRRDVVPRPAAKQLLLYCCCFGGLLWTGTGWVQSPSSAQDRNSNYLWSVSV